MFEMVFAAFLAIGHLLARLGQAPLLRYVHLRASVILAAKLATTLAREPCTAEDVLVLRSRLAQQREHAAATIKAVQVVASQPAGAGTLLDAGAMLLGGEVIRDGPHQLWRTSAHAAKAGDRGDGSYRCRILRIDRAV